MEGTIVREDPFLKQIPVNPDHGVKMVRKGGELLLHVKYFTPELQRLLTFTPKSKAQFPKSYYGFTRYGDQVVGLPRSFAITAFPHASIRPPLDETRLFAKPNTAENIFPMTTRIFPSQVEARDAIVEQLLHSKTKSAMLNLPCGVGKTVISFSVAHELSKRLGRGLRILFCCFVNTQIAQAIERIQDHCHESVRIGVFQQDRRPKDDDHIVVCSMDTLRNLTDARELEPFDIAIFDEAHHMSSETRVATNNLAVPATYKLAMTATLERPDGLEYIVNYMMGPLTYQGERTEWIMDIFNVPVHVPNFAPVVGSNGVDYHKTVMRLFNETTFCDDLVTVIEHVAFVMKRKVCVTSQYLRPIQMIVDALGPDVAGKIVGGMTQKQRDLALTKDVIVGTESCIRESLDTSVTAVIPATSIKFIGSWKQVIGRANRSISLQPGCQVPLAVDVYCSSCPVFRNHHSETRPDKAPGRHQFNMKQPGFAIYRCSTDMKQRVLVRSRRRPMFDGDVGFDASLCEKSRTLPRTQQTAVQPNTAFRSIDDIFRQMRTRHHTTKRKAPAAQPTDPPTEELKRMRKHAAGVLPRFVYTDGACQNNGRHHAKAGVGVYFGPGHVHNVSCPLVGDVQTNQRAELTAFIMALNQIHRHNAKIKRPQGEHPAPITIMSDSKYVVDAWNRKWVAGWKKRQWLTTKGTPVANQDLWERAEAMRSNVAEYVDVQWVKGHSGCQGNDEADRLAVEGISK
jgi:ribonuclease HI